MLILSIIIIILDQITKKWALDNLRLGPSRVIIKDFFELTYVENSGAAFGILQNRKLLFVVITVLVVGGILTYMYRNNKTMSLLERVSLLSIMAGAIGNFIDRIFRGYVIDFFSFQFGNYYFPVFNIADIAIVIGTGLLIFIILSTSGK